MSNEAHKLFSNVNNSAFIKEARSYKAVSGFASALKKELNGVLLSSVPAKNIESIDKMINDKGNIQFKISFKDMIEGKSFDVNAMSVVLYDDDGVNFYPVLIRSFDTVSVKDAKLKLEIEIPKVFLKVEEMSE